MPTHHNTAVIHLRRFALACLPLALTACASTTPRPAQTVPLQVLVPILYATDRDIVDTANPEKFYGAGRADMSYGVATVALSTRKQGESAVADWSRWQARDTNPKNRNELLSIDTMAKRTFGQYLDSKVADAADRSVLVYIHGYSRKFDTAARNMAVLAYEMDFRGVPVLYSWPSKGSPLAYADDAESLQQSTAHLLAFLRELVTERDVDTVHVAAHSMGNRGLLKALVKLVQDQDVNADWKFGEIVLFAPDVGEVTFQRQYLPLLQNLESRTTIYVSAVDVPLRTSTKVNSSRRIGDANEYVFVVDGIETVDITTVTRAIGAHSAYRGNPELQADLYYLINQRLPADDRPTLLPVDSERGRYWSAREVGPRNLDPPDRRP